VNQVGLDRIAAWEQELLAQATERISGIEGVRLVGTAREKASVLSFVIDGIHPHDVGTILDSEGVAVRAGHHCAQPVMDRFKVPATTRASFAFYNTNAEAAALEAAVRRAKEIFG
jgi:cysteine desulfurase/selenocysteine lyase